MTPAQPPSYVADPRRAPPAPVAGRAGAALAAAATLAAACGATPVRDPGTDRCTADVRVRFSPSISRPSDPEFLQGLVQGSGYDLRYVRTMPSGTLLRLSGPAEDTNCRDGVIRLRRDPSVKELTLDDRQQLPRVPSRTEAR